ncbi:hypothetical protein B0T16DRAFT_424335 [Cercophora newfieldiana]|uniref:Uncharacterized protein n=1 Tax=Cercophora newfieldiana TaxID=92897 RepID=A0AA40D016_9PEZI|nr:hypothetical protein B0T16DRAFT_424335 [Cercophora newfieldiana]
MEENVPEQQVEEKTGDRKAQSCGSFRLETFHPSTINAEELGPLQQDGTAPNKATILVEVSGKLLKEYPSKGYKKAYNQAFTRYPKDPDFVEGVEEEEYYPFPIHRHVPGAVLYEDKDCSGPDGTALVYARNLALSYMGKSDPSSITTFTTDGTILNLFAQHATLSEKGTLEYHQYPIKKIDLISSYKEYKEGRRCLRNAQDRAREQSYALKDQLKEYYDQQRGGGGLHPVTKEVPPLPDEVVEHQPVHEPVHEPYKSSSGKQKASTSQSSHNFSRHVSKRRRIRSYWKQDRKTGRYYHGDEHA